MEIKTQYAIKDVVWTASEYGIEQRFVKAIKIYSKRKLEYGFESSGDNLFILWNRDERIWYAPEDVFATEAEAELRHAKLKTEAERESIKEKEKSRRERIIKAKAELEAAENDIELDDGDDY